MSTFPLAISFVLKAEGGYVNDPSDPGGETNFGICKRSYPDLDIRNLTGAQASDIYKRDFWDALHLDSFPGGVAIAQFDAAVNMGPGQAGKLLQGSCNFYPGYHLAVDGVVGPKTISAVNEICRNNQKTVVFVARMLDKRRDFYTCLANSKPSMRGYLKGWLNRVDSLSKYISKVFF